jgi:hypothetical protein
MWQSRRELEGTSVACKCFRGSTRDAAFMEQGPVREADSPSASQDRVTDVLWLEVWNNAVTEIPGSLGKV